MDEKNTKFRKFLIPNDIDEEARKIFKKARQEALDAGLSVMEIYIDLVTKERTLGWVYPNGSRFNLRKIKNNQ